MSMQAWDTAVGQELDPMLTGSTFNAVVANFTAVLNPNISTAGVVQGYGFPVNGYEHKALRPGHNR